MVKYLLILFLCLWSSLAAAQKVPATYFALGIGTPTASQSHFPTAVNSFARIWDNCDYGAVQNCGTYPSSSSNPCLSSVYYSFWVSVAQSRGNYTWDALDHIMAVYEGTNVNINYRQPLDIMYTFGKTPAWANGNTFCRAPPLDFNDYYDFVRALVTRYKGRIKYYEMWNEPNLVPYWSGTVQQLVEMTNTGAAIIKSIDPDAIIVSPSMTGISGPSYFIDYMQAGGCQYCQLLNIHTYPFNSPPQGEYLTEQLRQFNQAQAFVGTSYPYIATEFDNNPASATPPADPVFLAVNYIMGYTLGITRSMWYLFDQGAGIGILTGPNQGNNTAGTAYRQIQTWLLNSTWTSPVARQAGTNAVPAQSTNGTPATPPTTCGTGSAGTSPTGWGKTGFPDANGVYTYYLGNQTIGATKYYRYRFCSLNPTGSSTVNMSTTLVAGLQNQWWTSGMNIALVAGSYTNTSTYLSFNVFDSNPSYLQTIGSTTFKATAQPVDQQRFVSQAAAVTNASAASVSVTLNLIYTSSNAFDITLDVGGNVSADKGTLYVGDLNDYAGNPMRIVWDISGTAAAPISYTAPAQYNYVYNIFGYWLPITSNTVYLTNSPVILRQTRQNVRI